ncbi:hypothetical protein [Dactylosporangium sp. CA-092794]|uniref:hypothetical protein n=1 Tax=Dactylosporangium sp. CA-092794 TaxID=3239929 RepID=UPI003D9508A4
MVAEDGRAVGSMRLIAGMEHGRRFWGGWPAELTGQVWEASRVSMLPSHRRRPEVLLRLLLAAGRESLEAGCETWIAVLSPNMLSSLTRLGIPAELLNNAEPIDYSSASGVQLPADGRTLIPAIIRVREAYRPFAAAEAPGAGRLGSAGRGREGS